MKPNWLGRNFRPTHLGWFYFDNLYACKIVQYEELNIRAMFFYKQHGAHLDAYLLVRIEHVERSAYM